jgi:hypothetical protein
VTIREVLDSALSICRAGFALLTVLCEEKKAARKNKVCRGFEILD